MMVNTRAKIRGETMCSLTLQTNALCSMAQKSKSSSGQIIMAAIQSAMTFMMKNLRVLSGVRMLFS